MPAIQPMIDAAAQNATITLPDDVYDDPNPVFIRKDVTLVGSRNAIVHSEFQVRSGAEVSFRGFTLEMNKEGAPARNGVTNVYPQNGMVVVAAGAVLWADDLETHAVAGLTGYALQKNAIHVVNGGILQLRAVTQFSRIDWRNIPFGVIEINYNSHANIFDISGKNVGMNIAANPLNSSLGAGGAAIEVTCSRVVLSGANVFNCMSGAVPNTGRSGVYGISAQRNSFVQVGAGLPTTVQYWTLPDGVTNNALYLDPSSTKQIEPGCVLD